jgi:hypothetical protein
MLWLSECSKVLLELREKLLGVYVVGECMEGFLDRLVAVLKITNLLGGKWGGGGVVRER